MSENKYYYGTGRRKTAVARVRLYSDNKNIIVTGKSKCISIADLFFNELNIFPVFLSEENFNHKRYT